MNPRSNRNGNSRNNNNQQNQSTSPFGVYVGARKRQDQRNKKKRNPLGKTARFVDYLDTKTLQRFINDQGKILPRRITGVSAYQQRLVTRAIKYARHLALLPFVANDVN
jgi:small subunit ribosomal protein S18